LNDLDLAAGVIVTGFTGTQLDPELRAALRRVPFAGYILFTRNCESLEQTRALTDALRAGIAPPPIVAIDQEGGRVMRLTAGVEPIPPMAEVGASGDADRAFAIGEQLARDLRRAGFTHDFAPVLDLTLDPRNTVIGNRSFGSDPMQVARLGGAVARGLEHGGITATLKHFPGHGATAQDTHVEFARLDSDEATLRARDMQPFKLAMNDAASIMAAHVAVPAVDGDRPASISPRFLTGILRDEWGYDGLIFTDCMQMDAIAKGIGTVQGVTEAIAAGADCALVSHDPQLAFEAALHLADAVARGEVPRERLREAHARVMRLRERASAPIS
jgi:beta-N-acetylhexosaminidase